MPTKKGDKLTCLRCQHTWIQRNDNPPQCCPKCKQYTWNQLRGSR